MAIRKEKEEICGRLSTRVVYITDSEEAGVRRIAEKIRGESVVAFSFLDFSLFNYIPFLLNFQVNITKK